MRVVSTRRALAAAAAITSLIVPAAIVGAAPATAEPAVAEQQSRTIPGLDGSYTLTILHNNDGESNLTGAPADPNYGGVARFATLERRTELREFLPISFTDDRHGESWRRGVITVSSGDNYLAGPQFAASLERGVPFYDSVALDRIGYDALALGNHEFDFGPETLADFISGFDRRTPFLSANLDVTPEPRLAELAAQGRIASSTVVRQFGERVGIVGATTPALRALSSPGDVVIDPDVLGAIQGEVDGLTRSGVNKIVVISHLQNVAEDRALVGQLRDVDVVIAGGGDELLANPGTPLVPGDAISVDPETGEELTYPLVETDATGRDVPVVTTAGDYKYLGRLVVTFDRDGNLTSIADRSGPIRVSGVAPDAVPADRFVQREVVDPVAEYVAELDATVVAQSEVALEGRRDPGVRTAETNLGNLLADALLDAGQDGAAEFGVAPPQVALQNSGGIRNNSLLPAGDLTELDTFAVAPFSNFVAVVPDVPRTQFREIMENAVSGLPAADGRFAQVGGFRFSYDPAGTAQQVDDAGTVLTPGSRIVDVTLDDGTPIVVGGVVQDGPGISVATNDFSARGGDQYPFRGLPFTSVGVSYQQALADYLVDDLAGTVTAADYPEGGEGRIVAV